MAVTESDAYRPDELAAADEPPTTQVRTKRLANTLSIVAGLGLLPLIMLTIADVTRRSATGKSVLGTVEIIEIGMVCVVFLAMMGAQVNERHIRTPLVTNRLPSRAAHVVRLVAALVSIGFLSWIVYETGQVAMASVEAREYRFGIVRVPIYPAKVFIPIGLAGFAFALVMEALSLVGKLRRGEEADKLAVESTL